MSTAATAAAGRPYRSELREARARSTRRCVVEAASAVFLERGYTVATVREIAGRAGVSVPTVELTFGRKSQLLKAAIDVAIAGDDEPVVVLDRDWARTAAAAGDDGELLATAADALAAAQVRSAGLVLCVLEGAAREAELADLAAAMVDQRARTAAWLVDRLVGIAPLRDGCDREHAVDVVWLLMDPAIFDRLTRQRHWSVEQYRDWFADAVERLLRGAPS